MLPCSTSGAAAAGRPPAPFTPGRRARAQPGPPRAAAPGAAAPQAPSRTSSSGSQQSMMFRQQDGSWHHGRQAPARPELQAALAPLAQLAGVDAAARSRAAAPERQQGVAQQAAQVAHLQQLLAVDSTVWQLALAVWRALGVADPAALARNNALVLCQHWLQPDRLSNLLALQRGLGGASAAAVVERCATYVAVPSCRRVTGRLLFLQQEGLLPLLVAREQRGRPRKGQPPAISVADVARKSDALFCALPALPRGAADRYAAFMARLEAHLPYQQLLSEAAALRERLLRDPEVARLAAAAGA